MESVHGGDRLHGQKVVEAMPPSRATGILLYVAVVHSQKVGLQ